MNALIALYVAVAIVGAIGGPLLFMDDGPIEFELEGLGSEGRVVLGILAGLLWPILALWGIAWVLRAAWRGVAQCVRLVVPKKVNLPRAEVRR